MHLLFAGLVPGVGTNMGGSPRTRRVLGDVTAVVENTERKEKWSGYGEGRKGQRG